MVGPKVQDFCQRINMLKGIFFKPILLSKSAKIVLSKSIFEVRNEEIFFFSFISEYQIIRPFFGTNMIFEILFPRFNF